MRSLHRIASVLALASLTGAIPAFANRAIAAETTANDQVILSNGTQLLAVQEMSNERGAAGGGMIISNQTLQATESGALNVSGNLTNGSINVGSNFGGSGFGSYVFNTGNNTAINSAVAVNVQMTP